MLNLSLKNWIYNSESKVQVNMFLKMSLKKIQSNKDNERSVLENPERLCDQLSKLFDSSTHGSDDQMTFVHLLWDFCQQLQYRTYEEAILKWIPLS